MAAVPAAMLRRPGRLPPPFSLAQRSTVHVVSRCPRSQGLLNVVAAARNAAAAADVADTVATSTAAGADDAPAPKKRGRPRKSAQNGQDPAQAETSAAPKPRGRKKKDTAAEGNGALAAQSAPEPAEAKAGAEEPGDAAASAAAKPRGRKKKEPAAEENGASLAPEAKQKATRRKKEAADDGAVKNLKLKFDKDEAEQQMVGHIAHAAGGAKHPCSNS